MRAMGTLFVEGMLMVWTECDCFKSPEYGLMNDPFADSTVFVTSGAPGAAAAENRVWPEEIFKSQQRQEAEIRPECRRLQHLNPRPRNISEAVDSVRPCTKTMRIRVAFI